LEAGSKPGGVKAIAAPASAKGSMVLESIMISYLNLPRVQPFNSNKKHTQKKPDTSQHKARQTDSGKEEGRPYDMGKPSNLPG
jgi:hypothetical protein